MPFRVRIIQDQLAGREPLQTWRVVIDDHGEYSAKLVAVVDLLKSILDGIAT
jgi:hypothetical protein